MITRICDVCKEPLHTDKREFLELTMRLLKTDEDQGQNHIEQWSGDYCRPCINDGRAITDLLKAFTKRKLA